MVGPRGVEPLTSRLSGVRSNHLSYEPLSCGVFRKRAMVLGCIGPKVKWFSPYRGINSQTCRIQGIYGKKTGPIGLGLTGDAVAAVAFGFVECVVGAFDKGRQAVGFGA